MNRPIDSDKEIDLVESDFLVSDGQLFSQRTNLCSKVSAEYSFLKR